VFDANTFIGQAKQEIADLQRRSMYYRLGFFVMAVVGPALLITGLITGFALFAESRHPDDVCKHIPAYRCSKVAAAGSQHSYYLGASPRRVSLPKIDATAAASFVDRLSNLVCWYKPIYG